MKQLIVADPFLSPAVQLWVSAFKQQSCEAAGEGTGQFVISLYGGQREIVIRCQLWWADLGGSAAYVGAAALCWLRTAWQPMSTILKKPFEGLVDGS